MVEQHKPHSKKVNSSAVNYEVRYAPHADFPVSNKTLIQRWYMVGMVGRTSQLACQRLPHVGPTWATQPLGWYDMVGPMSARRMIFDGEMCSRLTNVGIWPLTNRRPRVVGPVSVLGRTLTYSIVCRFDFFFSNTFIWYYVPLGPPHTHTIFMPELYIFHFLYMHLLLF